MTARRPNLLGGDSLVPHRNAHSVAAEEVLAGHWDELYQQDVMPYRSPLSRRCGLSTTSPPKQLSLTEYGPDSLQQWVRQQIVKARLEAQHRGQAKDTGRARTWSSSSEESSPPSPKPRNRTLHGRRVRRVSADGLASDEADLDDDDEELLSNDTDDSLVAPLTASSRRRTGKASIQDLDSKDTDSPISTKASRHAKKLRRSLETKSGSFKDLLRRVRHRWGISQGQDNDVPDVAQDREQAESGDEITLTAPSANLSPKRKSHHLARDAEAGQTTKSRRRRVVEEDDDENPFSSKTSRALDFQEHANDKRTLLRTADRTIKTDEPRQLLDVFDQDEFSPSRPRKLKKHSSASSIQLPRSSPSSATISSSGPNISHVNHSRASELDVREVFDGLSDEVPLSNRPVAHDMATSRGLLPNDEAERFPCPSRLSTEFRFVFDSNIRTTSHNCGSSGAHYYNLVPEKLPKKILSPTRAPPKSSPSKTANLINLSLTSTRRLPKMERRRSVALPKLDGDVGTTVTKAEPFPRDWHIHGSEPPVREPLPRQDSSKPSGWPEALAEDVYRMVSQYLSHADVCNLRLTSKTIALRLESTLFRSVVTNFGPSMFDTSQQKWTPKRGGPLPDSVISQHGDKINKFGIAFEVDLPGLYSAEAKDVQGVENSWWGNYSWPLPIYPRFSALQAIEDLVDHNQPLLKLTMKSLTKVSELGLSIDSGHGWIDGPDRSDMAIYESRCAKGTKVFGKAFPAEDKWHTHGRNALFQWAQRNTLNEAAKSLRQAPAAVDYSASEIRFVKSVVVREMSSFENPSTQPDHDPGLAHTGGRGIGAVDIHPNFVGAANVQLGIQPPLPPQPPAHVAGLPAQPALGPRHAPFRGLTTRRFRHPARAIPQAATKPQWPIIINGFNIAAELGGTSYFVQNHLPNPASFPLLPGKLTEAQAQWLMETAWAQRSFLSAYTTSIISNKVILFNVHTLTIAKISSGLLPSIEQREFWSALPNLATLKILVSPDWRTEHTPGDRGYQHNMLINPMHASVKFAEFLHRHISRIEHLSALTIGFIGGGEHADGIFARNQHVLPAPITRNPRAWISDHVTQPDMATMMKFDHIKDLKFENCWFSPIMLKKFMEKSTDTSLRRLTLDSVSLTAVHSTRTNGAPLSRTQNSLAPLYPPEAWLQEPLPSSSCWPALLDSLTPGTTFLDQKHALGILNGPPPPHPFRGHVQRIILHSCGYVHISGISDAQFNQSNLVGQEVVPMDDGLYLRRTALEGCQRNDFFHQRRFLWRNNGQYVRISNTSGGDDGPEDGMVMMSRTDPTTGIEYFGLGTLTQVIHPVEKRVLEQAWGMQFGWGSDMTRWRAVEDGCFEGGTGRFSGSLGIEQVKN